MPKSKQNLAREILTVALLLAAVAASEYWFFQLWRLDWSVPMLLSPLHPFFRLWSYVLSYTLEPHPALSV